MTPHVELKPGAGFPVLAPAGIRLLSAVDQVAQRFNVTLTVTSGSEPMGRLPSDPHPQGKALDVGIALLEPGLAVVVVETLRKVLGPAFTVLVEAPPGMVLSAGMEALHPFRNQEATGLHLHLQPVKGTEWP